MHKSLEFKEEFNPWSIYILEDGTRLKMRNIVMKIEDTGALNPDGSKQYQFQAQLLFVQDGEVPILKENLKKDLG